MLQCRAGSAACTAGWSAPARGRPQSRASSRAERRPVRRGKKGMGQLDFSFECGWRAATSRSIDAVQPPCRARPNTDPQILRGITFSLWLTRLTPMHARAPPAGNFSPGVHIAPPAPVEHPPLPALPAQPPHRLGTPAPTMLDCNIWGFGFGAVAAAAGGACRQMGTSGTTKKGVPKTRAPSNIRLLVHGLGIIVV